MELNCFLGQSFFGSFWFAIFQDILHCLYWIALVFSKNPRYIGIPHLLEDLMAAIFHAPGADNDSNKYISLANNDEEGRCKWIFYLQKVLVFWGSYGFLVL